MESILLEYHDNADLYDSYMPFFKHGGLFFRTDDEYDFCLLYTSDAADE